MKPENSEEPVKLPPTEEPVVKKAPIPDFDDYWAHKIAEKAKARITSHFGIIAVLFSIVLTLYGIDGIKQVLEKRFVKIVEQKEKEASLRITKRLSDFEKRLESEMLTVQTRREEFLRNTVLPPQYRDSGTSTTVTNVSLEEAVGPIRDQGAEGTTVGFSLAYAIQANLRIKHNITTQVSARGIYVLAKKYDEWPGESYEGTSVLGGIKAAQRGIYLETDWPYSKTTDISSSIKPVFKIQSFTQIKDISQFPNLLQQGNVIPVSITITEDFDNESPDGLVTKKNSAQIGGHVLAIVAYDRDKQIYKFANSWGSQWGTRGFGFIKESYLRELFQTAYVIQAVRN